MSAAHRANPVTGQLSDEAQRDLTRLCALLAPCKRWVTSAHITAHTRTPETPRGWHRRYIAALADCSYGRIISTTRGYMLSESATDTDRLKSHRELVKKGEQLLRRAGDVIRYRNNLLHYRQTQRPGNDPAQPDFFQRAAPPAYTPPPRH